MMNKKQFFISLLFLLILAFAGAVVVHGQGTECKPSDGSTCPQGTTAITLNNPFSATCGSSSCGLVDLFKAIISNILLPIGGVLIVCAFIFGGFQLVMAQGKPANITKAKNTILFAAIGAVLILGAWAIQGVIQGTIKQLGGSSASVSQ